MHEAEKFVEAKSEWMEVSRAPLVPLADETGGVATILQGLCNRYLL